MIPFRDNIPSERTPALTYAIIALNALVFLYEVAMPAAERDRFVYRFGVVPREFAIVGKGEEIVQRNVFWRVTTRDGPAVVEEVREYRLEGTFIGAFLPLITSMFLHGGWMHLVGNMWFLWIFGDNVEDRLGRVRYLTLYILGGLAASASQVAMNWDDTTPMIGASGAVAGVLGAYFVAYPHARVLALVPFFNFFWSVVEIPAVSFLIFWVLFQIFQGTASLVGVPGESVAWWAHVGGFLAGIVLMRLIAPEPRGRRGPIWTEWADE
jgi:membrane associated rhomboid family serine protease